MRVRNYFFFLFILSCFNAAAQVDTGKKVLKLSDLSLDDLMNIKVVTASGFEETASDAPSTIVVITSQQIQERGYEQLEDALRDVPGIDMVHLNGFAPTVFYFRGLYGVENLRALLMIDGIPENNVAGTNDMAGPAYSLHNIDRIEVIWGPASALYGNNAFGGVVNMITKNGADINGLKVEGGRGTTNTSFERAMYGTHKSGWDVSFSGSVYKTDGPRFTNWDPNYSDSYVDNAWSFYTTISYTHKRVKTTLGVRAFDTPMGWGELLNSPTKFLGLPSQGNGNAGTIGILSSDFRGERPGLEDPFTRTVFLQSEYTAKSGLSLMARAQYRESGIGDESYIYLTTDGTNLRRFITTQFSNRTEGEITANYKIGKVHNFAAGIQYYQDNLEYGNRVANADTTQYLVDGHFHVTGLYSTFQPRVFTIWNTFGSYLQYTLRTKLLGKTDFTAGARYDNSNIYSTSPSPRLAVVNHPNDALTLKLLYGTAFRAPTISEYKNATTAGTSLSPEKIRTFEANIIYKPSANYLLQVNGFLNYMTDIILQTRITGLLQNTNNGKTNVHGLEAKADVLFSKYFSGFANLTLQDGEQIALGTITDPNKDSSFIIPNIAKAKGNLGLTVHVEDAFTITLIGNWVGTRAVLGTNPHGNVDGYFLTNFVISTNKILNNRVTASINIHNLFNVNYLDPGLRAGDGNILPTVLDQPGLTGLFKIGVSF